MSHFFDKASVKPNLPEDYPPIGVEFPKGVIPMRVPAESEPKLEALLEAAQQEPVFIERGDQSIAVVLSAEDYDRLTGTANQEFQDFCDAVSDRAIAHGLTETKLNDLLDHA
jgi:hypothetical protein